ncbi:MAG: hypothetical protein U0996_06995 [Planctomycetaceae bacterium]
MTFQRKKNIAPQPPALNAKWPGKTLDEGFVPFPKRLLRCAGRIFGGAHAMEELCVMLAIVDFLRPDLYRWPSYEYLAFIAGMSEATVRRTVTALSERGLLVADEKSDGQVTLRIDGLIEKITSLTDDAT